MKSEVSAFLQGKQFVNTNENQQALTKWLADRSLPRNSENLAEAIFELAKQGVNVMALTPAEQARQDAQHRERVANDPILKAKREAEAKATAEAAERAYWAERSKPLPGENSLQTLQRVHVEKEEYARKKQPKATPAVWTPSPLEQIAARERDAVLAQRRANYNRK